MELQEKMAMQDRLQKQLDFILEVDKMKNIIRQTYLSDGSRKENDAEHSYHLAVMCFFLSEYANEPINVEHTMQMVLLHDVIEIDAGDTYAYDAEANKTKTLREQKAAEHLYGMLPVEQGERYKNLWQEFEDGITPEARFANALDRVQPVLLTNRAGGQSWLEHGVKKSQIMTRVDKVKLGSEQLYKYVVSLINKNVKKGLLVDE